MTRRVAHAAQIGALVLALALVPAGLAAKGGGGGGGNCTRNAPDVFIDNNSGWSPWGSWGMPGQQLKYGMLVTNRDVGCRASSFTISVAAPDGFSVSIPTTTISLRSSTTSTYLWAHVTSPSAIARRRLPAHSQRHPGEWLGRHVSHELLQGLLVRHDRAEAVLAEPDAGTDDHRLLVQRRRLVRRRPCRPKIDFYMDGAYMSSTACDNLSYTCSSATSCGWAPPGSTQRGSRRPTGWGTSASRPWTSPSASRRLHPSQDVRRGRIAGPFSSDGC